jgi:hypothetical protein
LSSGEVLGHSCAPAHRGPLRRVLAGVPSPFQALSPPGGSRGGFAEPPYNPVLGFPPALLARSRLGLGLAEAGGVHGWCPRAEDE